jgi:heme exporter protein A
MPAESVMPAVEVRRLVKSFDDRRVLNGIDLSIEPGERVVIFGPNGAGKTTLIKILATIINPSSGDVLIDGVNVRDHSEEVRRRIGIVSHHTFLYNHLTAQENLDFYRRMYDVPEERIREVAALVGMDSRLQDRVATLSRGMQQRFSIARALLPRPSLIFMDEPETGLDQQSISLLWEVLRGERGAKRTVVLTTHSLERGFDIADRWLILSRGKIVYQATKQAFDLAGLRQVYELNTKAKA